MAEMNTEKNSQSTGMPDNQAARGGKRETEMKQGQCLVMVRTFDPINSDTKN